MTEKYVQFPNLPEKAKLILLGEKYKNSLDAGLKKLGIDVLYIPDNPNVDMRISGHADISVLHLGKEKLLISNYLCGTELEKKLMDYGFDLKYSLAEQEEQYPLDADLNICIIGNKALYGKKNRLSDLIPGSYNSFQVSQGYARCSVCILNERAIICADAGISEVCKKQGIDVLKIAPGFFTLEGYDYGFIGGSCFKINKNQLVFTGKIHGHEDERLILDFCKKHNIEVLYLTDQRAFDIGTAIPIIESGDET